MHTNPYHPYMQKQVISALEKQYGFGHFGSKASHKSRILQFCDYVAEYHEVVSLRDVTRPVVEDFAATLMNLVADSTYKQRTAIGLLSTVNVVLAQVHGDRRCWVSPCEWFGKVLSARTLLKIDDDPYDVVCAAEILRTMGEIHCAQVILACRYFGMRFREALLADYARLYREALEEGKINIIEGTKNGRSHYIDRWIEVGGAEIRIIQSGLALQGSARNIIPAGLSLIQFARQIRRALDKVKLQHRLTTFHDLRAAFACELYHIITGFDAPVVAGRRLADRKSDREARNEISYRLGHGRHQVAQAYVGSTK